MASVKEKKTDKIILGIAIPFAVIAIILSLTGVIPLGPGMTYGGIFILVTTAAVTFYASKKQKSSK